MYSYFNEAGHLVKGTAAFLHYVFSECGGIKQYNNRIAAATIRHFIKYVAKNVSPDIANILVSSLKTAA